MTDKKHNEFKIWLIILARILIKFMLRYGIPFILTIIALVAAILVPINYYWNGSVFDIKRACIIIPLMILFQMIAQFISYKLIRWCSRHNI